MYKQKENNMSKDDDTLNNKRAPNPTAAAIDASRRSLRAIDENPHFFTSSAHLDRVDAVKDICTETFGVNADMRINHRGGGNGRKPFTVVKVMNPSWPISFNKKDQVFSNPLKALGNIVRKTPKSSNSVLIRIF